MKLANIFESIPDNLDNEIFENIIQSPNIRVERIISKGQSTPDGSWYDQDEHEWVMLLEGEALLWFEDGSSARLRKGDHINIPAHCKHKVAWTDPDQVSIWLAVFYK